MKRKMLCLAMAVTMGLSMTTTAFAKVGSGKTDKSQAVLTASDSAMIQQYVINTKGAGETFDVKEVNYDGNVALDNEGNLVDHVDTQDASKVLNEVIAPTNSQVMITVTAGKDRPVSVSERINPDLTHTKVIEFMDKIINSSVYESVINNNAYRLNNYANNLTFKGKTGTNVSIRQEAGWKVFADAVAPMVKDQAAFDNLKIGNKKFETVEDLRYLYTNARAAFKTTAEADVYNQVANNVMAVTGKDFIKVIPYGYDKDGNRLEGKAWNLEQVAEMFAAEGLNMKGEDLTIDNLEEAFGHNLIITGVNPTSGYEHRLEISVVRK